MASTVHPLDPLSAAEIERAWEIVRAERAPGPRVRVIFIMLHEPAKKVVLAHRPGDAVERAAFVVLVDSEAGKTYEAVVSLSAGPRAVVGARARRPARHRARRVRRVRGGRPRRPALAGGHAPARGHRFRASPWWTPGRRATSASPQDEGRRLVRALTWVRRHAHDNGYARPVANLLTVVDLNAMAVVAVEDGGVVPLPPEDANYSPEAAGTRTGLKPIEIRQPEGPSFELARPRAALAEVADADRLHAPRGARAPHGQLRGPGARAAGPLPGLDRRHGGALRRPAPDLLPPQRLRRGRVRHRHAGQRAPARLRLPGRDPLLRRGGQRQPGPRR